MAQPRYTRIDNRRPSSNYCSTVTVVVFVALCLVGIWMMTSSSVGPAENVDVISLDNKDGIKKQMTPPAEEGNNGETPTEDKKDDGDASLPQEDETPSKQENQEEKKEEKTQEESTSSGETKSETEDLKDNPDEENPDSNEKQTKPETEDNESGEDGENQKKFESDNSENKSSNDDTDSTKTGNEDTETKTEKENTETNVDAQVEQESQPKNESSGDLSPPVAQLELLNETMAQNGSFSTQATESKHEKEAQKSSGDKLDYKWTLCNTTAGPDYIPCLDNVQAIRSLSSTKHYEHRERHCPEKPPTCLVPLPEGYKRPIEWPKSREKIWYTNVPHTKLAEYKGHQNWVKVTGEYLTFPGGGTQFKHGALHYIDFIQESVRDIAWGKRSRVVLDVGCGVASFGGFLFDRDVITMSLAPKDEHEAQVQFALERGIPAISAVMGTTRLPFPGRVFDIVHCARCRVPWHIEGGKLLLELNRVLRPGGFFVWSATPVYQKKTEDVEIWKGMSELTKQMCWELISINKDTINGVGVATYRKPNSNECYKSRSEQQPPICPDSDDPNASWKVPLQACMHTAPEDKTQRGSQWPEQWPERLEKPPFWLSSSQTGVYGKAAPEDFSADYEHWKRVVTKSYLKGLGINWASVRNVMDMRAVYGGFAAALRDLKVWVMNVVPIDSPDTLAIIYERGLFGIYHDWCESFSTYPRSYDLLHADHLFSKLKQRCNLTAVVAEVDRVLRPEGKLIVRDDAQTIQEVEAMVKAMKWEVSMTYSKEKEGLLSVKKSIWRPNEVETLTYAIA
ncbi:putative methyltransferase PMT26 [Cardamine amara subsp. amara]|uniref:Methyltransferase PMT26 n=1 Tax=Cardamine amara subsp. amara TaxID=228776 RepID=A0ABD1AYY0_CARAN